MKNSFADVFDIAPLGGTVENPQPLPGNKVAKLFIARTNTELNAEQEKIREQVIAAMLSEEFDETLLKHFIDPVR